jgi:hypothetical protein
VMRISYVVRGIRPACGGQAQADKFLEADGYATSYADYAESLATERSRRVFIRRTTGKEENSENFVDFSG